MKIKHSEEIYKADVEEGSVIKKEVRKRICMVTQNFHKGPPSLIVDGSGPCEEQHRLLMRRSHPMPADKRKGNLSKFLPFLGPRESWSSSLLRANLSSLLPPQLFFINYLPMPSTLPSGPLPICPHGCSDYCFPKPFLQPSVCF